MAANLNRPADFVPSQCKEKTDTFLIPPSEFEKPVTVCSRAVEKVPKQSRHLNAEDVRIKELHNKFDNLMTGAPCGSTKKDYADELIQRQTAEIANLRSEYATCRLAYEKDAAEWKAKFSFQEEEHETKLKFLEKQLARTEEELEEKLFYKETEVLALKEKLESTQQHLNKRVEELEKELISVKQESDNSRRLLETELRNRTLLTEDQAHQIARLKTYICEAEQTHKPALAWKMEKEAVDNKLKIAQAENEKLSSKLELMEVRFQALNEILTVQENQLGQAKSGASMKSKQASSLITRWREKVFCLLVQAKTAELVHKKNVRNLQQKIQDVEDELADSRAQVQVLQHSQTDKSAQLQIEINLREKLQEELDHTHQVAVCLDEQSKQDNKSVQTLSQFVIRFVRQADELMKVMEEKSSFLKVLGQRVHFASNRMDFIKTQLIRKSAFTFGVSREVITQPISVSSTVQLPPRDDETPLSQELEKLMQERDSLAAQVRADAEKWSKIVKETRSQYAAEAAELSKQVELLKYELQQKSQNCSEMSEQIENLKEEVKEKDSTINQLNAELSRYARGMESVLTDQRLKDEAEWSDRLADLERKLNNSKREHAKAVIYLRQMEQSHKRRLEQEQDLLKTTEEHFTRQNQQLEARLRSVERERNMMMATLKQEGLLEQLKTERGRYVEFVDEHESDRNKVTGSKVRTEKSDERRVDAALPTLDDSQESNSSNLITSVDSHPVHEPVAKVLEDLQSLTAAIFDNDDDGDDDDDSKDDIETKKDEFWR